MLTTMDDRAVLTGGIAEQNAFTIKSNAKAFKVLIDGLYSNKILAVVRELSSNARDSHVAAGCVDRPFDWQLPTTWEPMFRVRDYGVSLSHDDVMHLYTTVFESTKDHTNTQVGKLGLGSKSPFAYTDTFTVTAWLRGEKRTYSAYIDAEHTPVIAFVDAQETDEEDGFEVSFPVKTNDVDEFLKAARQVAYGFDVLPNVVSGQHLGVDFPEVVMEDAPLWKLVKGYVGFRTPGAVAKQGCVLYPLDPNAIPGITPMQRAVLQSPFVIEFPIGDLEISASRESLGYNKTTCQNILRVVDVIAADIQKRYQDEIAGAATYWEALLAYASLMNSALEDGIKKIISEGLSWRGRKLVKQMAMFNLLERAGSRGVTDGGVTATKISAYTAGRRKHLKWEPFRHWDLSPRESTIYFENVTEPTGRAADRIKYHRDSHRLRTDVVWFKADPASYAWKRLYVAIGRPPLVDVAALPKPPATVKGYGTKKPVPVRAMLPGRSSFSETQIVESDRIVYVRMERGELDEPGLAEWEVPVIAAKLRALGYMDATQPVVAIPATHKRMIDRNKHWVHLKALAQQAVQEKLVVSAATRAKAYEEALDGHDRYVSLVRIMHEHGEAFAATKSPAGRLHARYGEIADKMAPGSPMREQLAVREIAERLGTWKEGPPAFARKDPIKAHVEAVKKAYPLLQDLESDFNDDPRKRVIDYVNLIDASQPTSQSAAA